MHDATAPLRDAVRDVRWVRPERLHVTLKFLGEQPEERVPPLVEALERIAARHAPVPLALREVGAFPSLRRPRIVWLGIAPEPRFELLQHEIESACGDLGYELDGRPFRPHVTLGRIRERLDREQAASLARAARRIRYREAGTIDSVDLMLSDLSSPNAGYTTLASVPLAS